MKLPDGTPLAGTNGRLGGIAITGDRVMISILIRPEEQTLLEPARRAAEEAASAVPGVARAFAVLTAERAGTSPQPPRLSVSQAAPTRAPSAEPAGQPKTLPGIKAVVAVASGKGGVGKSTTAANLAVALARRGLAVGLLDADIFGPSQPRLFGLEREKPESIAPNTAGNPKSLLRPLERYGVKLISIGFLVDERTPMIWRGPMVVSAITQLLKDVAWGPLDILLVDMPPGTGDVQLTLAQQTPLAGAIIVSTPQDLALLDARRGIAMFQRVEVPVLGIVENMSSFCCPNCGTVTPIFGSGGARAEAEKLGVPFLGEVPLHLDIRLTSDAGRPVAASPEDHHAAVYAAIAARIADGLQGPARQKPAPRIVIE